MAFAADMTQARAVAWPDPALVVCQATELALAAAVAALPAAGRHSLAAGRGAELEAAGLAALEGRSELQCRKALPVSAVKKSK